MFTIYEHNPEAPLIFYRAKIHSLFSQLITQKEKVLSLPHEKTLFEH